MATTSKDLLESARRLARGKVEVDYRNAASRAYYAAYHACRPVGERIGLSAERNIGVHAQLGRTLTVHSKSMTHRSVGYMLRERYNIRIWADYDLDRDFSEEEGNFNIRQCARILRKIEDQ